LTRELRKITSHVGYGLDRSHAEQCHDKVDRNLSLIVQNFDPFKFDGVAISGIIGPRRPQLTWYSSIFKEVVCFQEVSWQYDDGDSRYCCREASRISLTARQVTLKLSNGRYASLSSATASGTQSMKNPFKFTMRKKREHSRKG